MIIIIPMAGLSKRFLDEGFTLPKYMLYAEKKSLFRIAVSSFKSQFDTAKFVFIYRNIYDTKEFISAECSIMGIKDFKLIELNNTTRGQAETVKIGIDLLSEQGIEDEIIIFNADTAKRSFNMPDFIQKTDGFLEVFEGEGDHWSFVLPMEGNKNLVKLTTEKVRISSLCSNGLYHFKKPYFFLEAYEASFCNDDFNGEYYIAPMYNTLIKTGKSIHFSMIPITDLSFFGTPLEYRNYLKSELCSL
jgi:hypothetical protein